MSMIGIDWGETADALDNKSQHAAADLMREMGANLTREEAENARLRKVIAHLMTNPLDTREHRCHTSDIDAQTGHVEITDEPGDHTTIRITDPTVAAHDRTVNDLGQVLDVEAGLAEVLATAPAEDAQRAAATVNDGLETLFRKLGPPTDRTTEQ